MLKIKFREIIENSKNFYSICRELLLFLILLLSLIILFKPVIPVDIYPYIHKVIDKPFTILVLLYVFTVATLSHFYLKQSLPTIRRVLFLAIAATLGLISFFNFDLRNIEYISNYSQYLQYLQYLILVLPTFLTLWVFRTYDVQRQIDKTQESINNDSFFECAKMLTAKESLAPRLALEQLAYLRNETEFDKKRIDYLTQNVNLEDKNLVGARLNNLDLSNAILNRVILDKAILKGTKFGDYITSEKDLKGTLPTNNVTVVEHLEGAVYNQYTVGIPVSFALARNMIYEPD